MKILSKSLVQDDFSWFNFDYYPDSDAYKIEIYLQKKDNVFFEENFVAFLKTLFAQKNTYLAIGPPFPECSWYEIILDAWKLENGEFEFSLSDLSAEAKEYFTILDESNIDKNYKGYCTCNDLHTFISIIVKIINKGIAVYSPIFYDFKNEFLVYFAKESIGIYSNEKSVLDQIKNLARRFNLDVKEF